MFHSCNYNKFIHGKDINEGSQIMCSLKELDAIIIICYNISDIKFPLFHNNNLYFIRDKAVK